MDSKITLVVALHIHAGREAEFEQFEARAASIMRRYGGVIERRIYASAANDDHPNEVHIVTFPNEQSFEQYRGDPDLSDLAEVRNRAIRKTTIWRGHDLAPFSVT